MKQILQRICELQPEYSYKNTTAMQERSRLINHDLANEIKLLKPVLSQSLGPYVVSTTHGELPISGFSKLKAKLDQLTGIEDWRFHDIRRGLSTHLEDNGLDRFYVERVLTHKDKSVTGIYARSNHSHQLRVIFNKWAQVLTSKDGNTAENVLTFYREAQ